MAVPAQPLIATVWRVLTQYARLLDTLEVHVRGELPIIFQHIEIRLHHRIMLHVHRGLNLRFIFFLFGHLVRISLGNVFVLLKQVHIELEVVASSGSGSLDGWEFVQRILLNLGKSKVMLTVVFV